MKVFYTSRTLFAHAVSISLFVLLVVMAEQSQAAGESFKVHNLFQSNMVLQRDKPVAVWGWGDAGEKVSVSFAGHEVKTSVAKDKSWKVSLPAMAAHSQGRSMVITCGGQKVNLENVLVGDVWVIGGQSNMQHPLTGVEGGAMEMISANFSAVRLLTVPPVIDDKPKTNFPRRQQGKQADGDWDVCSPHTVRQFSAIGYIFGRRLHMASQVPIGLIDVSRWGTTVESWTPRPVLQTMEVPAVKAQLEDWKKRIAQFDPVKDLEARVRSYKHHRPNGTSPPTELSPGPQVDQNYPGNGYNSFIVPISGLAVKGAIFHQGYNNSRDDAAEFYHHVFPKMITAWRAAFQDPKMPFGIISLCTDNVPQTLDNYCERMMDFGIYVREAQYKTFLQFHKAGDKNVGFASSFNLRHAWYHPQNKIPAGESIARWALATQYGYSNAVFWKPPMVTKMEIKDGSVQLHFDSDVSPAERGAAIVGFAISGKDKKYQPAYAEHLSVGKDNRGRPRYNRKVLVLTSPHVKEPLHYRYAWGRNPLGNLRASGNPKRHIAVATQRSDDWAFWEISGLGENTSRQPDEKIREALRLVDLERRVKNARAIVEQDGKRYEELKK